MAARKAGFEVAAAAVKSRAATHAAAECVSITCYPHVNITLK